MTGDTNGRRTFLKQTGVIATGGVMSSFAGCLGDLGLGDDGDGGIADRTEIRLVIPPLGYSMVGLGYIRDETNILANEMDSVGYDYDITVSWDDTTLFAAGQVDTCPTIGDIECAQIATERDMELTMHGLAATNYEGIYVRRGDELDPENTGSVEDTIRRVAEEDILFGNAGWNQGEVPAGQITFQDKYDLIYTQEGGDFNVTSADWFTLPELLVQGEVDMIVNAPPLGAAPQVVQDPSPIKDILWYQPGLEDAGLDARTMNLGMWPTSPEFSEHHEDAMAAFMRAWVRGIEYVDDPANYDEIVSNDDYVDALNANNAEEARVILEFGQQPGSHQETMPGNTTPIMLTDIEFTDDFIETDMEALQRVTGDPFNLVQPGWEELLEYKKLRL